MAFTSSSILMHMYYTYMCVCVCNFCLFCVALGLSDAIVGFYPAFNINMFYQTVTFTQEIVSLFKIQVL